jgi:predicted nucleotide-binding protein
LGSYEYIVTGVSENPLTLRLTPRRGDLNLGKIVIIGNVISDGKISGRWSSDIGTEGVFKINRSESTKMSAELPSTNSVFVVHGHDEGAKHSVARFLEQLGINPVILQEQINRGMTVIEKFEDFANRAGFAVVLMTPDDYGHSIASERERKLRPRQNVVLELGYFAAKLGRDTTWKVI